MFSYRAYGLEIIADEPIPELPASNGGAPVNAPNGVVKLKIGRSPFGSAEPREWLSEGVGPDGQTWFKAAKTERGFVLRFEGLADFLMTFDGNEVAFLSGVASLTAPAIRHLIIDQVLPRTLNLLGHEALHATAVSIGEEVCAFVGPPGIGKSTIAASFQRQGYDSVCDDCLVLKETETGFVTTPGYPGIRLWQDSLEALGGDTIGETARVAEYSSKFRLLGSKTVDRFVTEGQPLVRLYLLSRPEDSAAQDAKIEPMTPAEIFPELVRSSFPLDITDRAMLKRHFALFSSLAARVPARRLVVPNCFAALPDVQRRVIADLRR